MRRAIAFALIITMTPACYRWAPGPALVSPSDRQLDGKTLRVTRRDSSRLTMRDVTVVADSIRGRIYVDRQPRDHAEPISGVHAIEHRAVNVPATVLAVVAVTTIGVIIAGLSAMSGFQGLNFTFEYR